MLNICQSTNTQKKPEYKLYDQITASFLESMGLRFEGIFVRDILNKVMPSKNSPTNKTGAKLQTMVNEYIVVFQK